MIRNSDSALLPQTAAEVRDQHVRNEADHLQALESWQGKWIQLGYLRALTFFLTLAPLLAAVTNAADLANLWWWLFWVAILVFLGVAALHETLSAKIKTFRLMLKMDRAALARVDRRLLDIQETLPPLPTHNLATCRDLDLFGQHSLYKLVGTVRTPIGISIFTDWISHGAGAEEVRQRQVAVQALKNEPAWRTAFQLRCEQLAANQKGPSDFVQWCQQASWFEKRQWVLWLSRIASLIIVLTSALMFSGLVATSILAPVTIAAVLVNFFLSVFFAGPVHDVFNQISSRYAETSSFQALFQLLEKCRARSPQIDAMRERLFQGGDIINATNQLGTLVWLANLRRDGLLFLIYLFFQLVFFWDVHVLDRLENWKRKFGAKAHGWFNDLGEWESLVALANFAADHPEWTFPQVHSKSSSPLKIEAVGLGHPLLPAQARIDNDVKLGPEGTFLLVTGSNMSGKSTLLRSIGLNQTLAQMGSVVCAHKMSTSTLTIDTSMRISDSLSEGVSFFMAELKRLKEIVDRSAALGNDTDRGHLFLLDEILQGTNSRERQIAVTEVVRQLVDQGSIGAISTHDLELADVGPLKNICQIVHFSESFEQHDGAEVMTFDYHMRPGVAPTTNALKLLEIVGLRAKSV